MLTHCSQNGMKGTQPQWLVLRNGDALGSRFIRIENGVTTRLVNLAVTPFPAKDFDQVSAMEIARNPHATAKISSRT